MERSITLLCLVIVVIVFAAIDWFLLKKFTISEEKWALIFALELYCGGVFCVGICDKMAKLIGLRKRIELKHQKSVETPLKAKI